MRSNVIPETAAIRAFIKFINQSFDQWMGDPKLEDGIMNGSRSERDMDEGRRGGRRVACMQFVFHFVILCVTCVTVFGAMASAIGGGADMNI